MEKLKFKGHDKNLCLVWLTAFLFEKFQVYGIAGVISVINIVQLAIFNFIAQYERNHFITEQLVSSMTKMFIV